MNSGGTRHQSRQIKPNSLHNPLGGDQAHNLNQKKQKTVEEEVVKRAAHRA